MNTAESTEAENTDNKRRRLENCVGESALSFTEGEPPSSGPVGSGDGAEPRRFPGEDEEGVQSSERRLHAWTGVPQRERRNNSVRIFTELGTKHLIRKYIKDRYSEEDFWDYNRDIGVMRRHHSVRRTELFGHDHLDPNWENSPFPRGRLSPWRRSTLLFYNGDIIHLIDCWNYREPLDQIRPSICDQGWWGFTDFGLIGKEDAIKIPAPFGEKQVWRNDHFRNDHEEEEEEEELNEDSHNPEEGGEPRPTQSPHAPYHTACSAARQNAMDLAEKYQNQAREDTE